MSLPLPSEGNPRQFSSNSSKGQSLTPRVRGLRVDARPPIMKQRELNGNEEVRLLRCC